jgi:hypothetical protein
MRILAAHPGPNFSVHDVYVGWTEALRQLGVHVLDFNLADRLTFYDSVLLEKGGEVRKAMSPEQAYGHVGPGSCCCIPRARTRTVDSWPSRRTRT